MRLPAGMPVLYETCLLEQKQVLGHRRLGNPGRAGQCAYSLLAFAAELLENGAPGRVGQRAEQGVLGVVHVNSFTNGYECNQ